MIGEGGRTAEILDREVEDGLFIRGAQISARLGGELVLDLARGDAGTGTPVALDTIFRIYCAVKPFTAVATAKLVEDGTLDLDMPLGPELPTVQGLTSVEVTLRNVLNHTTGLYLPGAFEAEISTPERRRKMVDRARRPAGFHVGRDAAYSEYVGWIILGRLIEHVTDEPLREHLRASVLDPLGLENTWIGMTEDEFEEVYDRLGVTFDMRDLSPMPLLWERAARWCCDCNPAHGGYTTAGDLARFYAALLERLDGGGNPALPSPELLAEFTSGARGTPFDVVLDRPSEYGLGFMVGLADHHFGPVCSPSSFGHSGWMGGSFGFADPEQDVAVAVLVNGLVDVETSFLRRPVLVRAIYEDLGLTGDSAEDDDDWDDDEDGEEEVVDDGAPRRRLRLWRR